MGDAQPRWGSTFRGPGAGGGGEGDDGPAPWDPESKCLVGEAPGAQRRFVVKRRIGEGQFASVYEAADQQSNGIRGQSVAVKIDKLLNDKGGVKAEGAVLRALGPSGVVPQVVDIDSARRHSFVAMEFLGKNLAEIRKDLLPAEANKCLGALPGGLGLTMQVGLQMLSCIAEMHWAGYIHRDIKPANFVVGRGREEGNLFIIDFGLAKQWGDGARGPSQQTKGKFLGSTSYASIAAHQGKALGRKDDLWGLLYILVELYCGQLPWRVKGTGESMDKDTVHNLKMECYEDLDKLCPAASGLALPKPLRDLCEYLGKLDADHEPDYNYVAATLNQAPSELARRTAPGGAPPPPIRWPRPLSAPDEFEGAALDGLESAVAAAAPKRPWPGAAAGYEGSPAAGPPAQAPQGYYAKRPKPRTELLYEEYDAELSSRDACGPSARALGTLNQLPPHKMFAVMRACMKLTAVRYGEAAAVMLQDLSDEALKFKAEYAKPRPRIDQ